VTPTPSQTLKPTQTPAAQPCPRNLAGAFIKQPLENDTPDAIGDCRPCGPQSQCWCGLAPTTPHREADHGQTTALASH
jgi:hypothetical protein